MPVGDIVPELILIGGGVACLSWALFAPRRLQAVSAGLALGALAVAGLFAARQLAPGQSLTFHSTWAVDDAAVAAKLLILAATGIVVALSIAWFRSDPRHGEYYTLLLFGALGAIAIASAADLMELILGVLLSSATGYVLAGYHRRSPRSGEAAIKYYLLGALANGAMVIGVVLLFGLAATTTFTGLELGLPGRDPLVLAVAVGLVAIGLLFKLGAVPAHAWMPDVADGAPAPVAAFLTSVPKIGALVALGRLAMVLPDGEVGWRLLAAIASAATMTLGNLAALWQDDVRRLLGWSAVSQSGYALMAVVALGRSPLALPGLVFFLTAYALGNLAAFGALVQVRGRRARADWAGLAHTRPWIVAAMALAFLSFVGIPPLAGFGGKLALFAASIEAGYGWLAVLAIANTVVSLVYYLRILGPAFFEPGGEAPGTLGRWPALGTVAAAVGVVLAGLGAEALLRVLTGAALLPGG